jgi:hypothetical protein
MRFHSTQKRHCFACAITTFYKTNSEWHKITQNKVKHSYALFIFVKSIQICGKDKIYWEINIIKYRKSDESFSLNNFIQSNEELYSYTIMSDLKYILIFKHSISMGL